MCGALLAPDILPRAAAQQTLRVGTWLGPDQSDTDVGLQFGVEEANRSASLFGWHVERFVLRSPPTRFPPDIHALIVGTRTDTPSWGIPIVALTCDAAAPGAFLVADCHHLGALSADERVEPWHDSLERFGAEQLNDRFRAAVRRPMTGDAWLGWFAMKMLAEAALRTRSVDAHALTSYLLRPTTQFDGHKGAPLRFDAARRLLQPVYVVRAAGGGRSLVSREVPAADGTAR